MAAGRLSEEKENLHLKQHFSGSLARMKLPSAVTSASYNALNQLAVSGGWQGAIAGGVVGGAVGLVAPWLSSEVGALDGRGMTGMLAATGTISGLGAAGGAAATVAGNAISNASNPACKRKSLTSGMGFGMALGGLALLMSGEAFIVGAGEGAVGAQTANIFGGYNRSCWSGWSGYGS